MNRMIKTLPQKLIFFILISENSTAISTELLRAQENQEKVSKLDDDEKLIQELGLVASDFYKKIIETTMLYFTGVLSSSDQFHKQLILETSKHMLYASQLFTQYISKLLKNPKVSLKVKIKRCTYISTFLIIIILWMKEYHQSSPNLREQPTIRSALSSQNFDHTFFDLQEKNLEPRQRPPLF